jgi:hypothetical protein
MRQIINIVGLFVLVVLFQKSYGQDCDTIVYDVVETAPEYPGGITEMYQYLAHIPLPNTDAEEALIYKFYFQFVITCEGEVTAVRALKNVDHSLTKYYQKHIEEMPNWTPGVHKGEVVNTKFILPISIHWD